MPQEFLSIFTWIEPYTKKEAFFNEFGSLEFLQSPYVMKTISIHKAISYTQGEKHYKGEDLRHG